MNANESYLRGLMDWQLSQLIESEKGNEAAWRELDRREVLEERRRMPISCFEE
jgi:hypothetical protein